MEYLFTGQLSSWFSSYDWSKTPLGAVENWSSDLKASLQILVSELECSKTSIDNLNSSLYNSQQRYDTFLKSIDQGFVISEMLFNAEGRPVDYRFLEGNSLFESMTGLVGAVGKTALELIPDLEDFWVETYGKVVLNGESVQFEHEAKALNRWFAVNAFPIDAPREFRFGVIFTDITARRSAEISLRLTQERLEISLAAGEVGAWDLDLVTKNAWHSIEHDRIFGYDDLLPDWNYDQFLSHVIEEDRARVDLAFQNAIANCIPLEIECGIRTSQGEARWIWVKALTAYNENGQPLRMYGVKRDISDRRRHELNNNFLAEIQNDLALIGDINQKMDVVGEKIRLWFDLSIITFSDMNVDGDECRTIYTNSDSDIPNALGIHRLSEYYSGIHLQKLKAGQTVAINDVSADPNIKDNGITYDSWQVRSWVNLPYLSEGHLKFLMGVNRRVPSVWREDELELMGELILRIYIELDRSRAESAVEKINQRFAGVMAAVDGIVFEWNIETNSVYRSEGLLHLIGVCDEEVLPNQLWWIERIHPDDYKLLEISLTNLQTNSDRYEEEYRVRHADGRWIDVWDKGYLQRNAEGKVIGIVGFIADISDRKYAETALRKSEERYRDLVELIPQMVWTADRQSAPIDVNQRWLDFTGITTLKEAQSQGLKPFLHPDDVEVVSDRWAMAQREGNPLEAEGRIKRHDGIYRWYLHQAIPIKNDQGQVIKWFGTGTDIETQKQLEQQYATLLENVQERNQELDQFSYVVSHDLKAPLRAISNLTVWLEEDLLDIIPPENQQQLQLMRSRVYRMEALIDGLLKYAQISREDIPLDLVSVKELLEEVIDSLAPPPTFTIEMASPLPTYFTKRILLYQVLANLIGNAIKHHDRFDGKVKISVVDFPDFSEFIIEDDGQGIDPQQQTRIYKIFQTIEGQNHSDSTGIGLAIVKKIVETEGGKIQLKSELGRGSTFSFTWRKYTDLSGVA